MRRATLLHITLAAAFWSVAACSGHQAAQTDGGAFATIAQPHGGLGATSTGACPQVSDAPEVRSAADALSPPQQAPNRRWSQSYTGRYDRCGALTAVVVSLDGAGIAGGEDPLGPRQVLFFHEGKYVGAADRCAFGHTDIKSTRGSTVLVQYRWPRGQETATTMSGTANIKYRWSDDKVIRVDQIPQELYDAVGCQR